MQAVAYSQANYKSIYLHSNRPRVNDMTMWCCVQYANEQGKKGNSAFGYACERLAEQFWYLMFGTADLSQFVV